MSVKHCDCDEATKEGNTTTYQLAPSRLELFTKAVSKIGAKAGFWKKLTVKPASAG